MKNTLRRTVVIGFVAFVAMPTLTTSACASSEESPFSPIIDAGKDTKSDHSSTGGSGVTGGSKDSGKDAVPESGTGGGTCNPTTCPTPAPPATKCCVTSNGPCGIDYGQGAGCQTPPTGDI